jgi:hypothetical protein
MAQVNTRSLHGFTYVSTSPSSLSTINASGAGIAGQHIWVLIINDATTARTITFGSNYKANGTLTGTVNKAAIVQFVSDGSSLYEVARTTGL